MAPATWDGVVAYCKQIKDKLGIAVDIGHAEQPSLDHCFDFFCLSAGLGRRPVAAPRICRAGRAAGYFANPLCVIPAQL